VTVAEPRVAPTAEEIRAFWSDTRAALASTPLDATVEPLESGDHPLLAEASRPSRIVSRVTLSSFEGRRIRAWLSLPAGEPPVHGWPAVMEVPGYGGSLALPLHLLNYGYATLSLFPRGQGESLLEWQIERDTRLTYNVTDRDRYYYRGGFMDCLRGIDFLTSRPEIDLSRIGVWGFSQGGGLTLATAALDTRVKAAVAGVPWLCDLAAASESGTAPYVELRDYLARRPEEREQALATLAYFDQVNLANDITCPVLMGCATVDEVHPLRSALQAFQRVRGLKSIVVYPDLDHGWRSDFFVHGKAWLDRYLR
jgi:cephalosporin-C deacetylase